MPDSFKYRGFISYSQKDKRRARALHRALEAFRLPRGVDVLGIDGRRLGKFFRDDEELSASADLGRVLETALEESENLIVLCSPAAAQSEWVNEEIKQFAARRDAGRIFAVILRGTPFAKSARRECFPPALKELSREPLAANLGQDGLKRTVVRLASGMLDLDFDDVWVRERRRVRTRRLTLATTTVVGVAAVAAAIQYSLFSGQQAGWETALVERAASAVDEAETAVDVNDNPQKAAKRAAALTYAAGAVSDDSRLAGLRERLGYVSMSVPGFSLEEIYDGIVVSADWSKLYIERDFEPEIVDARTGAVLVKKGTTYWPEEPFSAVISPDRNFIAGTWRFSTVVWNFNTGELLWEYAEDGTSAISPPLALAFSPDGKTLVGAGTGLLSVWDIATGDLLKREKITADEDVQRRHGLLRKIAFSNDGQVVHLLSSGGLVASYDLVDSQWQWSEQALNGVEATDIMTGRSDGQLLVAVDRPIDFARFAETGEMPASDASRVLVLASANDANPTEIDPWGCTEDEKGDQACFPASMGTSNDKRFAYFVTGRRSGQELSIAVLDLSSPGDELRPLKAPDCAPTEGDNLNPCTYSAVIQPTETSPLITAGNDGVIHFWNEDGRRPIKSFPKLESQIEDIALSGEGRFLVVQAGPENPSVFGHSLIWLFDVEAARQLSVSGAIDPVLPHLAHLSKDGFRLLTVESNGPRLWTNTGTFGGDDPINTLERLCGAGGLRSLMIPEEDRSDDQRLRDLSADVCLWEREAAK